MARASIRWRILAVSSATLAGALLTSALVVAPIAFRVLPDDHARAGVLAGQVFTVVYWWGLATGLASLLLGYPRDPRPTLTALLLVVLSGFELGVLVPLIASHGQGWPFSFEALHGTASLVHLGLIATAFGLTWLQSGRARERAGLP